MTRRDFITLLGGAAAWPLAAGAQQRTRPLVAYLHSASAEPYRSIMEAFHQGLAQASFIEGQNVAVEYRWAGGRFDRLPALASELVLLRPYRACCRWR
jgi:putative tryptophan/tyrosine transport system substrate-binding protein